MSKRGTRGTIGSSLRATVSAHLSALTAAHFSCSFTAVRIAATEIASVKRRRCRGSTIKAVGQAETRRVVAEKRCRCEFK